MSKLKSFSTKRKNRNCNSWTVTTYIVLSKYDFISPSLLNAFGLENPVWTSNFEVGFHCIPATSCWTTCWKLNGLVTNFNLAALELLNTKVIIFVWRLQIEVLNESYFTVLNESYFFVEFKVVWKTKNYH